MQSLRYENVLIRDGDPYDLLHPFFKRRLGLSKAIPKSETLPQDFMAPAGAWKIPEDVSITETTIPCAPHPVRIRIYKSAGGNKGQWLLWMHGGGFVSGDLEKPEAHAVCAELAHHTNVTCVSLDYTLSTSPEGRYPRALEEVRAAWNWIGKQCGKESARFIGGASAGANLAAAFCRLAAEEHKRVPDGLLSVYGVFHGPDMPFVAKWNDKPSILPEPLRFTTKTNIETYEAYVGRSYDLPDYSVPGQGDVSGFPPTLLIVSEFDDLGTSSICLANALEHAHVPVRAVLSPGMLHGFLNWYPVAELGPSLEAIKELKSFMFSYCIRDCSSSRSPA